MILRLDQPPDWEIQIEETSAGVYRATGRSECGHRFERVGPDPDVLLDICRITASALIEPGVAGDYLGLVGETAVVRSVGCRLRWLWTRTEFPVRELA